MDRPHRTWTRRAAAGALLGLAAAPTALAQEASEPRLLTNILTRMALEVSVNGHRRTPFVLDTGAGRTVISRELADALALPRGPDLLVHGLTAAELAPTAHIGRFLVGPRHFEDLLAPVFPRAMLAADGLVGLDVLGRFRLNLDIASRRITLRPSGPDVVPIGSAGGTATRVRRPDRRARLGRFGQLILTNAEADGVPVDVFVDSGAQYSIGNLAMLRAVGGQRAGLDSVTVYGVTGQMLAAGSGQVASLRLGTHRLGATPLLFADLHAFTVLALVERPALLIGADLLYRFREVILDFGQSRMSFSGLRRASA